MPNIISGIRAANLVLDKSKWPVRLSQNGIRQLSTVSRAGFNAGRTVGRHIGRQSLMTGAAVMPVRTRHMLASARIAAFVLIMFVASPFLALSLLLRRNDFREALTRRFYKVLLWLIGIRVIVHGTPIEAKATLYVANHMSYFDIPVLGSLLKASFISRGDVAHWPVIGALSKLQRTIFTSRNRAHAAKEATVIRDRLKAGDRLLMFPEGRSGNGQQLLPFKSTFFVTAAPIVQPDGTELPITVQPISMTVIELSDLPIGRYQRPFYAWFGDMDFAPHLWQALQLSSFTVEVRFHPATTMADAGGRKPLCAYCEREITAGFEQSLSGRIPPTPGLHFNVTT